MNETASRHHGIRLPMDVREWLDPYGALDFRPKTDLHTIRVEDVVKDGTYFLRAELPGIDPENIDLVVAEGTVTILAERPQVLETAGHSEFHYGAFSRMVRLPATAKENEITACYTDGVLTVRVPLEHAGRPAGRKVAVERER